MSLYVEQRGTGPDLLMLHGWGLHGGLWGPLADELAHHFRITLVDLPGHGYSRRPDRLSVTGMAKEIAAAVSLNKGATVLGWSLGGFVALELAREFPDRFNRLVWIAGTPSFVEREGWPVGMALTTLAKFADGLKQDYRATLKRFISLNGGLEGDRPLLKTMQQQVFDRGEPPVDMLDQGLAILRNSDMRSVLATCRQPLLLIQGTHDRLVHPDSVEAIRELHDANVLMLEGAGHAPFLAKPGPVAEAIRNFVS